MEQIDHVSITIEPQMSDYIRSLTSVTVILQHIEIVTIQWKNDWCGWKFVMIGHKVFTSKINVFRSISVDFFLPKVLSAIVTIFLEWVICGNVCQTWYIETIINQISMLSSKLNAHSSVHVFLILVKISSLLCMWHKGKHGMYWNISPLRYHQNVPYICLKIMWYK